MTTKRDGLGFVWPTLLGAALRLYQLPAQILVDDEWHLVHRLRDGAGLASIVGDFGGNDHSIGLGVCAWLLMQMTALDETLLRLPSVLAGVLLIAVVPAALARQLGRAEALGLAWLLAVSPLLCFFSRLARPYAITTLLVSLAFLAMLRWLAAGERRAAVVYVASAALAPLFHLPALPAVLAPLALPFVARRAPTPSGPATPPSARATTPSGRQLAPSARQIAGLVATTLAAVAAVLAVPAWQSGAAVAARVGTDRLRVDAVPRIVELLTGSGAPVVVAMVVLVGLVGLVALGRRDPLLTRQLLVVIVVQAAAIAASGASALHVPLVVARYFVVVLPLVLIFPAAGLVAVGARLGVSRPQIVGAAAALGLLAAGPLGWIHATTNGFTNHVSYQADYMPGRYAERFRPDTISPFYDELAARPAASVTIVETPWYYYFHPLAYLQRHHRQHVVIGFVDDGPAPVRDGELALGELGLRLRHALHLGDRAALHDRRIDYVILHRDPRRELRWPKGVDEIAVDVGRWEARHREWFGAPVAEDAQVVVFAVR